MMRIYRNLKIPNILNKKKNTCITYSTSTNYVNHAKSGQGNFEEDYETLHVETTPFQKFLLGLGSGMVSLADPSRGDMIAVMAESTGTCSMKYIHSEMSKSEEGRAILKDKPRINSHTVDLNRLKSMPEGTLGKAYSNFLEKYKYSPDTRMAVRFVDDTELAYVIQRYREVHDLFHTMFNMPTNMLGEVTVKWVEAIQTRLPMCVTGALFGSLRLAPKFTRMYSTKISVTPDPSFIEEFENKGRNQKNYVTKISPVELPKHIQETIKLLFEGLNIVQLRKDMVHLCNYIEMKRLPLEEREIMKKRQEINLRLIEEHLADEEMSPEELKKFFTKMEKKTRKVFNLETYHWKQTQYDRKLSYVYLAGRAPFEYAVLLKIFNEIHKRDKNFQPRNLFDFGSGVGTVSWAAFKFWEDSIREYFTVDSSNVMNDLALLLVHGGNVDKKPFLKTLYQREFLPVTPEKYDLVVSSFSFMEVGDLENRLKNFLTLWNKVNKYLVIVENGSNAGFKIINEFREFLIHLSGDLKTKFHFFAPCPHDLPCPRFYEDTIKKTPCNFDVKYQQLKHISKTGKEENYVNGKFCYLVIKKNNRLQDEPQWPRLVRESQLRRHHVRCQLCTSQGELQEVVFTKSKHGKEIYRCARSLHCGDLFPGEVIKLQTANATEEDSDREIHKEEEPEREESIDSAQNNEQENLDKIEK